jgi:hypothetical protein
MSGGSWDFVYLKVDETADRLKREVCPHRKAFGEHLSLCASALHVIERVDSSDCAPEKELADIKKVLERPLDDALESSLKNLQSALEGCYVMANIALLAPKKEV